MTRATQHESIRRAQLARIAWAKLRAQASRRPAGPFEPEEEPENPATYRAMDLALRIGELLLASGEATETVTEAMRSLSVAYGLPRAEASVTFTAITISCLPGNGAAPITGERVVRRRSPEYSRLVETHKLVEDAALGLVDVDEAFARLREIKRRPARYPGWLIALSLPLLAASASVLAGGGAVVAGIAFLAAFVAERTTALLARRGVAEFYQIAVAAMVGSATGIGLIASGFSLPVSAVITGAIMALLPGRPLVASVQDGISGAYISSGARLLEVFYIVAAIVAGVGVTVYAAARLGIVLPVGDLPYSAPSAQPMKLLGAIGISVSFALALVAPVRAVFASAVGGGLIWVAYVLLRDSDVPQVMAVGIAAAVIGLLAHLTARLMRSSALPYVVPIIGPLLPGTLLYQGLAQLNLGDVNQGLLNLSQAIAVALALAVGISVGGELMRTLRSNGTVGTSPGNRPAAKRTGGY
ncbi:MAG: threonine/serine exporter family protein [Micromonosporaceae bacterium]|nr:threonine/serine exporter family protein [Micromonosporaceae bacterium]